MSTTTEAPSEGVVFHSGASNLRVVRKAERHRRVGETDQWESVPGKDFQFYDGVLRVTDSEDIDWLRNHETFGDLYFEPDSENAPRTENSAQLQRLIVEKALDGDFDGIADILVAERHSHSRPEVISACEAALNKADEELPPVPDTPLHEVERVRVGRAAGVKPGADHPVNNVPVADVNPSTLETPPGETAPESVPVGTEPKDPPAEDEETEPGRGEPGAPAAS